MAGDWLWILGDDHEFADDALLALLKRNVDIVAPLNVMRQMPFQPLIFDDSGHRWDWEKVGNRSGMLEVDACGNAGMLIRKRVFDKLEKPYFGWAEEGNPYAGSDLGFCWKAREAGFKVHLDFNVLFGHTTLTTFVPTRLGEGGEFGVVQKVQGEPTSVFRFKHGQMPTLFEQKGI